MRGADAGNSSLRVSALAALWAGILYDTEVLDEVWARIVTWTPEEHQALEIAVAKHGFNTPFRKESVRDLCLWILDLSSQGLKRRNIKNIDGKDESCYLEILQEVVEKGLTFAEQLLHRFNNEWQQDMEIAMRVISRESSL